MDLNEPKPTLADFSAVAEYFEATVVTSCLRAVVRLRVPDAIADGAPCEVELATAVGANQPALKRMLRLLEAHEFVRFDGERVHLTSRGHLLRTDVSPSIWTMFAAPGHANTFNYLHHTLQTGEPAFVAAQGVEFWEYLGTHADEAHLFDENMRRQGELLNLSVLSLLQVADASVVVDVGGGTGSLLCAVLTAHPGVHGVLFERDDVIDRARAVVRDIGVADRCSLVVGDLRGLIPTGDCYLLARVLHDWDDKTAREILSAIRCAALPSAVLNIIEMVVPPGGGRHVSKYSDITMLALFPGGRERSEEEFANLLQSVGWRLEEVRTGASFTNSVLIARPMPSE